MSEEQRSMSLNGLAKVIARRLQAIRDIAAEKNEQPAAGELARLPDHVRAVHIAQRPDINRGDATARHQAGARGHCMATESRKARSMKPRRKPHVLDKIRTGKFAEGSKGPFSSDIMMRMKLVLGHLAKKSMTIEEVRTELNTYFSEWFGERTLNHVPSDAFRRTLLVDRMVGFVAQIRAGGPVQPLWN
jgi:hypothetical protein